MVRHIVQLIWKMKKTIKFQGNYLTILIFSRWTVYGWILCSPKGSGRLVGNIFFFLQRTKTSDWVFKCRNIIQCSLNEVLSRPACWGLNKLTETFNIDVVVVSHRGDLDLHLLFYWSTSSLLLNALCFVFRTNLYIDNMVGQHDKSIVVPLDANWSPAVSWVREDLQDYSLIIDDYMEWVCLVR